MQFTATTCQKIMLAIHITMQNIMCLKNRRIQKYKNRLNERYRIIYK